MDSATTASDRRVAVVVAGGSARRMGGVDKLALQVAGRTLLDRVLAAVVPLCDQVVVVGPTRPTVESVIFTVEDVPGGGPVPAVAAGLAVIDGAATVVLLAADLPLLTTAHLELLFAALSGPADKASAAVDERGRLHPLLAVHRGPALRARLEELGPELSGLPAARLLPPATVAVELGGEATLNVNHPADLDRVRALIGAS